MKLLSPNVFTTIFSVIILCVSCEKEELAVKNVDILGQWKLTELNSPIAFDINADGVFSTNLLNEIECTNNEVLSFDALGGVQSVYTFNYGHRIAQLSDETYQHEIECGEELLAWATDYVNDGFDIYFLERKSTIKGNKLYTTYENSIEIHNTDFSEVLEELEIEMVYTKVN